MLGTTQLVVNGAGCLLGPALSFEAQELQAVGICCGLSVFCNDVQQTAGYAVVHPEAVDCLKLWPQGHSKVYLTLVATQASFSCGVC